MAIYYSSWYQPWLCLQGQPFTIPRLYQVFFPAPELTPSSLDLFPSVSYLLVHSCQSGRQECRSAMGNYQGGRPSFRKHMVWWGQTGHRSLLLHWGVQTLSFGFPTLKKHLKHLPGGVVVKTQGDSGRESSGTRDRSYRNVQGFLPNW